MEHSRHFQSGRQKKAYLLALCLTAQRALADVQGGAQTQEKALLDQVMQAIKEPSAEHVQIYVGLGLAFAVIVAILSLAFGGKKNTQKITFDEIDDGTPRKPKGKKAEAASNKKEAKQKPDDEWEDETFDKEALLKDIDEAGSFDRDMDGTINPEQVIAFRKVIAKHSYIAFQHRREEFLLERIEHLKKKRNKEYQECLAKAAQEFGRINLEVTQTAAEHIELDEANFEASFKNALNNPAIAKQIKEDDEKIRLSVEKQPIVQLDKDKAKEILLERIQLEVAAEKKLNTMKIRSAQEAQQIMILERTKVMDQLYMKYNVKLADIQVAIHKHDLENDPDVIAMKNANKAQRDEQIKQKQAELKASFKLSEENMCEVKNLCVDAPNIDITPDMSGLLQVDEYIKIFSIILTLQIKLSKKVDNEYKDRRRDFLHNKNEQMFAQLCGKQVQEMNKIRQGITFAVLEELKVPTELYDKTGKSLKGNPEVGPRMQELVKKTEIEERSKLMGPDYVPLDREVVLGHIEAIEKLKAAHVAGAIFAAKIGKLSPQQMPIVQEISKIRAIDLRHIEHGIDDSDIVIAFNKYDLAQSDEFKAIMEKAQQQLAAIVNAQMQRMQQQMSGMGGPPGMGPPGMGPPGMGRAPGGPPQHSAGGGKDAADLGW